MLTQIAAAVAALAIAFAGWQTLALHRLEASVAQEKADAAEAIRRDERVATRKNQEIDRATQNRIQATRVAAAGARADADGLRDALIAVSQRVTPTTGCADEQATITRLAGLLTEAGRLLADGKGVCGSLADQVTGFHEYTKEPDNE